MKVKEFIETLFEQTERELELWNIQKMKGGEEFLYSTMPTKEHVLDGFDLSLEDPWEELEDEWTDEADKLLNECKNKISEIYDCIVKRRIEFAKKNNIDVNEI